MNSRADLNGEDDEGEDKDEGNEFILKFILLDTVEYAER